MSARPPDCAAAILAGGRSSRMGGGHKALMELGPMWMIRHVVRRLGDQADPLLVSVGRTTPPFTRLDLPLVEDRVASHRGPLAGLYSALSWLAGRPGPEWLLLSPCDAPFLPLDLARRLLDAARGADRPLACARYDGHLQPTFSLWHEHVLPDVRDALHDEASGGLIHALERLPHAVVDWPQADPPPFFNVNTPEDLERARAWLDREAREA